ncbi:MAG: hypothetical protein HDT38_02190 [Clostridiales bacterium]|nr:hypothetical protein [Clostridiales bacterium]
MAERKREGMAPPALGGSSLLVAFAVLALTVFALLSLSTVRADVRLADASAKAVEDYYAADVKAQEILARLRNGETVEGVESIEPTLTQKDREQIDWVLDSGLSSRHEGTETDLPLGDVTVTGTGLPLFTIPAAKCVGYAVPISDTQELQVEVLLYGTDYEVRRWQAVPIGDWEPDDHLNVWTGEDE